MRDHYASPVQNGYIYKYACICIFITVIFSNFPTLSIDSPSMCRLGTLFGIDGKSKDNIKARVDLEALCDKPLQNMKEPKGKQNWTKPKAWFNLGRPAMREIILWVKCS